MPTLPPAQPSRFAGSNRFASRTTSPLLIVTPYDGQGLLFELPYAW